MEEHTRANPRTPDVTTLDPDTAATVLALYGAGVDARKGLFTSEWADRLREDIGARCSCSVSMPPARATLSTMTWRSRDASTTRCRRGSSAISSAPSSKSSHPSRSDTRSKV